MMRTAGVGPDGVRLRALIVVLWRAGLRIGHALARSGCAIRQDDGAAARAAPFIARGRSESLRQTKRSKGERSVHVTRHRPSPPRRLRRCSDGWRLEM